MEKPSGHMELKLDATSEEGYVIKLHHVEAHIVYLYTVYVHSNQPLTTNLTSTWLL